MKTCTFKFIAINVLVVALGAIACVSASAQTNHIPIVGCDFDDGGGAWDKTPDDLNASDGITVSGWTHIGGTMSQGNGSGRPSAPVATLRGEASRPGVGDDPPTNGIHSFSITIPPAKSLALTRVEFDFSQSMSSAQSGHNRWIAFRTSLDSKIIFSQIGIWQPDLEHITLDLSGSEYEKLSGQTVDFHWYNGGGTTFGVDLDSVVISGVFSPKGTLITLR